MKYGAYFANIYAKKFNDYVDKKKDLIIENVIQNNVEKKKTATITLHIQYKNNENQRGHAFLDYITNNPNTKHILNFSRINIINQKDAVELVEDIFVEKKTEVITTDIQQGDTGKDVVILELYSFTKNVKELRLFLDDIEKEYCIKMKNKLGDKPFYFNMTDIYSNQASQKLDHTGKPVKDYSSYPPYLAFTMKPFETNRKFMNLFGEEIDVIKKRVEFFIKNKKWYDEKGIPYTLGLLLSGNPGTGKTSVIKCLANETQRHIININFNNTITKQQMENLFFNEVLNVFDVVSGKMENLIIPLANRIYVFEDIDCQSDLVLERRIKNSKEYIELENAKNANNANAVKEVNIEKKLDLSFLLNLMDGIKETPARIIIMTANHPDILDEALIRPGRIDVIANFGCCTHKTIIEMIEYFYDCKINNYYLQKIKELPERVITPAFVSKYLFENMYSMEDGIKKCLQEIRSKINVKTLFVDDVEQTNDLNKDNDVDNDVDDFLLPLTKTIDLQQNTTNNNIAIMTENTKNPENNEKELKEVVGSWNKSAVKLKKDPSMFELNNNTL
ncbi:MAG: ATP-binding protein, partial [Crocinitomicaceae bacterium]|nr:ATP-binding protein [Crocinitomicaceae bacterium]